MTEMVERVARASFDYWVETRPEKAGLTFEDNNEDEIAFAMEHARRCIAAMREPTQAMLTAGLLTSPDQQLTYCWEAMIDAALRGD